MEMIFRFWNNLQKKWVDITCGQVIKRKEYHFPYTIFGKDDLTETIIATQSIGITDKNGKKIFVGDWIHNKFDELYLIQHDGEKLYALRYIPDYRCQCQNCIEGKDICYTTECIDPLYSVLNECEVVSNEFEHPELYKTFYNEEKLKRHYIHESNRCESK